MATVSSSTDRPGNDMKEKISISFATVDKKGHTTLNASAEAVIPVSTAFSSVVEYVRSSPRP